MAVNLTATARLNTGPFTAGLKTMQAGLNSLSATQAATSAKTQTALDKEQASRKAAGAAAVAQGRSIARQEASINRLAAAQDQAAASSRSLVQGLSGQRYLYGDMARMSARAAIGISAIPIAAVAAGVAWQKSFADVVRTADPDVARSELQVNRLRTSLVELVQSVPTNWGEVTEIATLANQMGVASSQTVGFTKAVAMFSATSNVSVDQTATAFGRLNSIVKDVNGDYLGLADSILKVGVNSVATESEIINISTQISSIAGGVGFTSNEIVGLSGALASVRVPPELSRGVVTRTFGQISRAVSSGGGALEGFAKVAGMSSDEFATAWRTDGKAGNAFKSFVSGLKNLGPQAEQELRGLGITSVRDVPVLLRLANAADSNGVVGGLLTQTMNDANNAAGETQRQYTIMAETIGAKLKVAGNNIMAFFDGMSRSSLGPLGNILDFVTDKIRDLTNSLDEPAELFGSIKLPFTNSELIGWVATAGLATAGLLTLGSAFFKVKEGLAALSLAGANVFGGGRGGRGGDPTGVGRIGAQWVAFPEKVRSGISRASAVAAAGYGRMAVAAERYNKSLTPSNRNQITYAGAGNTRRTVEAIAVQRAAVANFQASAERAAAGASNAFSRAGAGIAAAGRGIGAAASFAFGPWGLAIGIITAGIATWVESTRTASTTSSDLAHELSRLGDSARALEALENIEIGGLFGSSTKPLENGFKSLQQLRTEMDALAKTQNEAARKLDPTGEGSMGLLAAQVGQEKRASDDLKAAYKTVDDAFLEMYNAGNGAQGALTLQKFTGSSRELMNLLNSGEASNAKSYFNEIFEENGLKLTSENLDRLARGELPAVRAQMLGLASDAGVTNAELESFDGGAEAFSAMAKGLEEVAKSFISYKDAVSAATDEDGAFSMGGFSAALQEQIDAQNAWATNLGVAGRIGGSEFVSALMEMGVEAQQPLQAIIDNFNETGGAADGAWRGWMDQIIQSTQTGAEQASAAVAAARDNISSAFQDNTLLDGLSRSLTGPQLQAFSDNLSTLGADAARKYAEGITDGSMSVTDALAAMALEAQTKVDVDFDITPAQLSLNTLTALANGTVTAIQLDALPALAQNAIWETVSMADGSTGFVQIDGENGQALQDVAYVVDTATGAVSVIPLTADDKDAIAKVNGVEATANGTTGTVKIDADPSQAEGVLQSLSGRVTYSQHVIQVMEERIGQRIARGPGGGGGITMANGGMVEFYANGGVRENHTAHIAPAGTMRTWAEPETGGEAYIPLSPTKRKRSTAILENVAQRFGMSLVRGTNVAQYADGGMYQAQHMSRQYAARIPRNQYTDGSPVIGSVTFAGGDPQDQFREFDRTFRRALRGGKK